MKRTLITLCLAVLAGTAPAQNATTADIDAAKASGAAIGTTLRSSSPVIKEGEIQKGESGTTMERKSSGSISSQMDYFKGTTGLSGSVETGSGRDGSLGARSSSTTNVDFSCVSESRARRSTGGYVFQLTGCKISGTSVSSVSLQMCSAVQRGGSCSDASAFSSAVTVPANTYATLEDAKLGLGCNDTNGACRLTVTSNFDMTMKASEFKATAQEKASVSAGDSNTALGNVTAMRSKKNADGSNAYESGLAGVGQTMAACAQSNGDKTSAGGSATTCDGKTAFAVNQSGLSAEDAASCSKAPQCIRAATKQTSFARSCTRTFPLTTKVCNVETKTKACDISWIQGKDASGNVELVAQNSCPSDDLVGATKFGSQVSTDCVSSHMVNNVLICDKHNRTDFYSFAPTQTGSCTGVPYAVGSSCITDPAQSQSQCSSGNWFGRTKSALECIVVDMKDPSSVPAEVGGNVIDGCGVCTSSQTGSTCYAATPLAWGSAAIAAGEKGQAPEAEDTCAAVDLSGCNIASTEQVAADGTGLVTSRRENYNCVKEAASCVEYAKDPKCNATSVSNFGIEREERTAASPDAMNGVLANVAVMNEVATGTKSTAADGSAIVPLIFGGSSGHCEKPTGSWGSNGVYLDCCKISLERPGGKFGKLNKCSEEDARLAAARRANYTHYLGDWCSKKLPWPMRSCIKRTQGYCTFPGVLPRLIQEQGREQLAGMAKSTAAGAVAQAQLDFSYYGTTGTWAPPVTANGSTVTAWQWPAYCKNLAEAQAILEKDPTAKECPVQLVNHFAVCEQATGCGALPEYPELGGNKWILSNADPIKAVTTALSRFAVATGACNPASGQCSYSVLAWPSGTGGRALVSKLIAFPVYAAAATQGSVATVGDYLFRPETTTVAGGVFPAQLPATMRLNYSSDGGQSWRPLDVLTTDQANASLPGTFATLSGHCTYETNLCRFKITATATVTALPWGSPQDPNCGGFTPGQISALDFSKMDFSEWLSTLVVDAKAADGVKLTGASQTRANTFKENFKSGESTAISLAAPQGFQMAQVSPSEGFGPFKATLKVGGYWPVTYADPAKDTDAVTGVMVDWGDCTSPEAATFVGSVNGVAARGFLGQHTYTRPQDVPAACGGGEANLTHTLLLKISTTKSGVQSVEVKVNNAFNTMPGAYRTNNSNSASTASTSSAVIPGNARP